MVQNTSHNTLIYPANVTSLNPLQSLSEELCISAREIIACMLSMPGQARNSGATRQMELSSQHQPLLMTLCISARLMQRSMLLKPARARSCGATPRIMLLSPPLPSSMELFMLARLNTHFLPSMLKLEIYCGISRLQRAFNPHQPLSTDLST